jgi:hypothetical protein
MQAEYGKLMSDEAVERSSCHLPVGTRRRISSKKFTTSVT